MYTIYALFMGKLFKRAGTEPTMNLENMFPFFFVGKSFLGMLEGVVNFCDFILNLF